MNGLRLFKVFSNAVDIDGDTVGDGCDEYATPSLRDAVDVVRTTRTNGVGGMECVEPNVSHGRVRWLTVYNGPEFETGCAESRSLHIPDCVSDASTRRIARLLGAVVRP